MKYINLKYLGIIIFNLFILQIDLLSQFKDIENFKEKLYNLGIQLELTYKGEIWYLHNQRDDINGYLDNLDFIANIDLEKTIGWNNGKFHLYLLGNNGFKPNEFLQSRHGISNIAAPNSWKLYTCFLEQNLFEEKISLLFGLYDFNSEFDSKETASLFLNPSHGIGTDIAQSGENGPSIFPTTSLGFRLKSKLTHDMFLLMTVLDGVPSNPNNSRGTHIILNENDGYFVGVESGFSNFNTDNENKYKFSGGLWYYTKDYSHLVNQIDNWGFYGYFEKLIYKHKTSPFELSGYGRLGYADLNINPVNFFIAGGLVLKGLIPNRAEDYFGVAFTSGSQIFKDEAKNKENYFESIIEITYLLNLFNYLQIQPNFQFIQCPIEHNLKEQNIAAGLRIIFNPI